jgi:argininosuccinate lyase
LFDLPCRGKAGKLQGNLMGVMAVLKGTPTTYNKDFQECWELMFDSVDALHDCIRIATGVLSTIKINPDRMMKVRCLSLFMKQTCEAAGSSDH